MAIVPTPNDFTAGVTASATAFNAGVRDPLNFLMGSGAGGQTYPRVHAFDGSGVACANGANTLIGFDTENYDTDNMHNLGATGTGSTSNSRVYFPTAGFYEVDVLISLANNVYATTSQMRVTLNAAGVYTGGTSIRTVDFRSSANAGAYPTLRFYRNFNANDYIEAWITQTSGGSVTTMGSSLATRVFARWVAL